MEDMTVGEKHTMIPVVFSDTGQRWQCFEHGPRCAVFPARDRKTKGDLVNDYNGSLTFRLLQEQNTEWAWKNFPDTMSSPEGGHRPLLGVVEEVGELCHAHLKGEQKIRHTPEEIIEMKKDAVGDILVYLANYCETQGLDMQDCIEECWTQVRRRDWIANPMSAGGVANQTLARQEGSA